MSHLLDPRHQAVLESETLVPLNVIAEATFTLGNRERTYQLVGASVTLDKRRSQRTTAELAVTVTDDMEFPTGIITPHGTRVDLRAGIRLTDGTESTVTLGEQMLVTGVGGSVRRGGTLQVSAIERSEQVVRWRFERPFTVPAPVDLADVVTAVLLDRGIDDVDLDPVGVTLTADRTFGLDAATNPWDELRQLTDGFGWRLWVNRHGGIVLDQPPELDETDARKLTVLQPVIDNTSTPANVVVARFEPFDGTPVVGIAEDDDPSSPTFVGGPYGRVTHFYASGLEVSQSGADQAAQNILDGLKRRGAAWMWQTGFNPTADPDDVLSSVVRTDAPSITVSVDATTTDIVSAVTTVEGRQL